MTVQWSPAMKNALLDQWETTLGTAAVITFRTGAQPADTGQADSGTLIATYSLASDWATAAAAGVKALSGLPVEVNAAAGGTIGHYRIKTSGGTCHEQGSVTATGGGGDITVDNPTVTANQVVRITAFSKTAPH